MSTPAAVTAAADTIGIARAAALPARLASLPRRESERWPATNASPTKVSTIARPTLKDATSTMPNPTLCSETADSSTTSAVGHGSNPPDMPSASSARSPTRAVCRCPAGPSA